MKDFTIYEYQERLNRMTELLSEVEGWGQGYQSSTGQTLIQLMVDTTDILHYMLERRSIENYLDTARLRTSIIARACELGYRYRRSIANTGFVQVKLAQVEVDDVLVDQFALADITIPAYTAIERDGVYYTLLDDVVIQEGNNTANVRVKQGIPETVTREVNAENYILFESYETIEQNSLIVSVNGVEYTDVTLDNGDVNKRALSFAQPDDANYDVKYAVEGMRILFGDGNFGKKPDAPVTIQYIDVDPNAVPINTLNQEFVLFEYDVTDTDNNPYDVDITNTSTIVGFLEAESDASIKTNARLYHKTNGRAVTNDDYAYWVNRSGIANIVDSKAFGEQEIESLVYNSNNVYVTYLKQDGEPFTVQEHQEMREYIDHMKTSQAHVVFNPADKLFIQVLMEAKKHPTNPISDEEFYDILYRFVVAYFKLQEGSIGREIQNSDVINDLYKQSIVRNGITYPLIDYVKLDLNGVYPFTFPLKTDKVFIDLDSSYVATQNDRFTLLFQNLISEILVDETDTAVEILTKMRDRILATTPFVAKVVLSGVALDAFGNPLPIEINPDIGQTMLIGTLTPYNSPTNIIEPAAIGSTLARVVSTAPEIQIQHFYYSSLAGRRPMIPMRIGTEITFTAPTDTDVLVYTRMVKEDPSTEVLVTTIPAGTLYEETFSAEHILQFEYVNNSSEDVIVDILYPNFDGSALGLTVESTDGFGTFTTITSSGDLSDYITVDYSLKLPVATQDINASTQNLYPNSVRIVNAAAGTNVLSDNGQGKFLNNAGALVNSGSVNYITGELVLPKDLATGDYKVIYDQNRYNNFKVGDTTALDLEQPKPNLNSTLTRLSKITLVNK